MTRLHIIREGRTTTVPLASITCPVAASEASRAVRGAVVEYREGAERRFYHDGCRILIFPGRA